jgi:hypothetical protein
MTRWKNTPWGGRLKLVLFSVIPLLLVLAVAQSCAYVATHRSFGITTDSVTGQSYYSMRIGAWPWSHRSLTPMNSLGLPDREFVGYVPKGDCVHVLFAGDSYTFGDATSAEFRWTTLVEGMTARRFPNRCIRFFNIGVRNTTIDTTIVRIHQVLPLIQPDVVILAQYQNDLTDLANPGSPAWVPAAADHPDSHWGTRLGRMVPGYNVSLLRYLTYNTFAFMIRQDIKYDVLGTWSVLEGDYKREFADKLKGIYHDLYGSLVKDMHDRDIEFAAVVFPSKMDLLAQRAPELEYFTGLAREFDVPHLSLMPALDAHRAEMPFYLYDGHMNEIGNRVSADAIWRWLFTTDPAPVPSLGHSLADAPLSLGHRPN